MRPFPSTKTKFVLILFFQVFFQLSLSASDALIENLQACPEWMAKQINADLSSFKNKRISLSAMDRFFKSQRGPLALAKFTISNNEILIDYAEHFRGRVIAYQNTLKKLSELVILPNTSFIISLHDDLSEKINFPIFLMAKPKSSNLIMVPDFEAIAEAYQVLENNDITTHVVPWEGKKPQLVWRGSSAQKNYDGACFITRDNMHRFSRIKLCQLSLDYPSLIDAKFTLLWQVSDPSLLNSFKGDYISYEKQLEYKYHTLIDGNSCSYTDSGWRFFTNSVVFKPDSDTIQWYYNELIPGIHYLSVKRNLDDLVEKIWWAIAHDAEAEQIAHNAREFAVTHLTVAEHLAYLYHAICAYSKLNFVK